MYLPGATLGLGLWSGLRWPFRAVRLLAALAVTGFLALSIIADLPNDPAQVDANQTRLITVVAPALVAFLLGQGMGVILRAKGGGGMK